MWIGKVAIAALVVMASFGLATWVVGVLVMPPVTHDPTVRWAVAPSAGVAAAALAALWAYDYAKRKEESMQAETRNGPESGSESAASTITQNIAARAPDSSARGAMFGDIVDSPTAPAVVAPTAGPTITSQLNQHITASAQGAVAEGVMFGNIIKHSRAGEPDRVAPAQDASAAPESPGTPVPRAGDETGS